MCAYIVTDTLWEFTNAGMFYVVYICTYNILVSCVLRVINGVVPIALECSEHMYGAVGSDCCCRIQ